MQKEIEKLSLPLSKKEADALIPKMDWVIEIDLAVENYCCEEIQQRILQAVKLVLINKESDWEDIEYWQKILPYWITDNIKKFTKEEYEEMMRNTPRELWGDLPWTFGSWLLALRDRAWKWEGYTVSEDIMMIFISTTEMPGADRISALKELIKVSGAKIINMYTP